MAELRRGNFLLMDGALGTELERHALPIEGEGWSALAVRDHAGVITDIHRQYLETGARIHIANSFALARHVLEPIGMADDFERLNRCAVALFEQAVLDAGVDRESLWVAGSISTFAANSDRSLLPQGAELLTNVRDQARVLQQAGVDLFALEMLFDVDVSRTMLQAVASFGLPIIAGFTCEWRHPGSDEVVMHAGLGQPQRRLESVLGELIGAVDPARLIVAIMHSDADVTDAALRVLRQTWQGPIAVYPNSGEFVDLQLQFDSVCSAEEFAQAALAWKRSGVQIIGGCCGIGPAHIHQLKQHLTRP